MIVLDTETTGLLSPEAADRNLQPRLVELAAIKLDSKTLDETDRIEFLCNPGVKIPTEVVKITGIRDGMLKDAKPFSHHYPKLCDFFLGERQMVCHNIAFDATILRYELERIHAQFRFPWTHTYTCTVEATEHLTGRNLSMQNLYRELFGMEFETRHRAMADTQALVKIVRELRRRKIL